MATSNSKIVAARLPMEEYKRVIAAAAERRMTVSDYVILQLDNTSADRLTAALARVEQLTAEQQSLQEAADQHQQAAPGWQQAAYQAQEKLTDLQQTLAQSRAELERVTQRHDHLLRRMMVLWDDLEDIDQESAGTKGMPERYWDEIVPAMEHLLELGPLGPTPPEMLERFDRLG